MEEKDIGSSRHSVNWSGGKWKSGVLENYKGIYEKYFKKAPILSINHSVGIEIVNPIETEYFRVYSILTPWMLDAIVEFMVDLNKTQVNIAEKRFSVTRVSPLTNEKTRWVLAGTSLVDQHPKERLISMGTHWSNDLLDDSFRIIYYKLHMRR